MADSASVALAREKVVTLYKGLLKKRSGTQLNAVGSKKARAQWPPIDPSTGTWDSGVQLKPYAWLINLEFDAETSHWTARPGTSRFPGRVTGSFNTTTKLQGILTRVIPILKTDGRQPFHEHSYWEWLFAFVFPTLTEAYNNPAAAGSGVVYDFDPSDGSLVGKSKGVQYPQSYVEAAIFTLVEPDDTWTSGALSLTYAVATAALRDYINVSPLVLEQVERSQDDSESGIDDTSLDVIE